ncbi:Rhs element Vgr protein [Massilia sp. 9096]|uniref:Rhs element Vgr protein n=1 Tax=Massilia sp. 9096 TaxID=1500894 RepID=UPI001EFB1746|nr:Rhs element Vgr protein [Massilia sp. 9096]
MDKDIKAWAPAYRDGQRYGSHRSRALTRSEITMATLLFGQSIDYGRVRIHARRYIPFQPKNCCMTPNGSMYFHHSCFLPDYTRGDPPVVHWFLHEIVHVWQHQLGYAVRLRGAVRIGLSYDYELAPGKTLADFNMEAQGDLLADYFVLKHLNSSRSMRQRRYAHSLHLYEEVLADFLGDPASVENLPRDYGRWPLLLKL